MSAVTTEHPSNKSVERLKAPRAAAIAGILFAILFTASISLIRINIPADLAGEASWIKSGYRPLSSRRSWLDRRSMNTVLVDLLPLIRGAALVPLCPIVVLA